jgi:hypothetical protein
MWWFYVRRLFTKKRVRRERGGGARRGRRLGFGGDMERDLKWEKGAGGGASVVTARGVSCFSRVEDDDRRRRSFSIEGVWAGGRKEVGPARAGLEEGGSWAACGKKEARKGPRFRGLGVL